MKTAAKGLALLFTAGVAACGAAAEPSDRAEEAAGSSSEALRALPPVAITQEDDQRTIVTTRGRPLEVVLASNVTTGFDWTVASVDCALGAPVITHVPGSGIGAPGVTTLTWSTASSDALGRHDVELAYRRPWESDVPPAQVFRFAVDVRRATRTVVLTAADDGVRLDVAQGTAAEVALASNPSTGYDWSVVDASPALPDPVITFTPSSGRVGAGGVTHLRWATRGEDAAPVGAYAITLAYARPWETGIAPLRTFAFQLTVSPR